MAIPLTVLVATSCKQIACKLQAHCLQVVSMLLQTSLGSLRDLVCGAGVVVLYLERTQLISSKQNYTPSAAHSDLVSMQQVTAYSIEHASTTRQLNHSRSNSPLLCAVLPNSIWSSDFYGGCR